MKRLSVTLTPELDEALKEQAARTGCPEAEFVRRAVKVALFGDAQAARVQKNQPVLFAPKQETR
ncbi:MAG: ribbon-helix-helix protein, CopG family [Terriglobales bacterium]